MALVNPERNGVEAMEALSPNQYAVLEGWMTA